MECTHMVNSESLSEQLRTVSQSTKIIFNSYHVKNKFVAFSKQPRIIHFRSTLKPLRGRSGVALVWLEFGINVCHVGSFLDRFGVTLGWLWYQLDTLLNHFGMTLGHFRGHFEITLESFDSHCGDDFGVPLDVAFGFLLEIRRASMNALLMIFLEFPKVEMLFKKNRSLPDLMIPSPSRFDRNPSILPDQQNLVDWPRSICFDRNNRALRVNKI